MRIKIPKQMGGFTGNVEEAASTTRDFREENCYYSFLLTSAFHVVNRAFCGCPFRDNNFAGRYNAVEVRPCPPISCSADLCIAYFKAGPENEKYLPLNRVLQVARYL